MLLIQLRNSHAIIICHVVIGRTLVIVTNRKTVQKELEDCAKFLGSDENFRMIEELKNEVVLFKLQKIALELDVSDRSDIDSNIITTPRKITPS